MFKFVSSHSLPTNVWAMSMRSFDSLQTRLSIFFVFAVVFLPAGWSSPTDANQASQQKKVGCRGTDCEKGEANRANQKTKKIARSPKPSPYLRTRPRFSAGVPVSFCFSQAVLAAFPCLLAPTDNDVLRIIDGSLA